MRPQPLRSPAYVQRFLYASRWRLLAAIEHILLCLAVVAAGVPRRLGFYPTVWMRSVTKRSLDLVGATLGLLVTSPLFLVVPILIKLDSPGPVFYLQDRVGLDRRRRPRRILGAQSSRDRRSIERRSLNHSGRVFRLIKFRSMVHHAEHASGPVWASQGDPRVTSLGRLLRRTRIDELPQFINVLAGDMSLVGPRPERPHFVFKFCERIEKYPYRHRVKPGITGLAQIEQGYDCDEEHVRRKVECDLRYIRRWSPLLDLWILARTVVVVASGWGAR